MFDLKVYFDVEQLDISEGAGERKYRRWNQQWMEALDGPGTRDAHETDTTTHNAPNQIMRRTRIGCAVNVF